MPSHRVVGSFEKDSHILSVAGAPTPRLKRQNEPSAAGESAPEHSVVPGRWRKCERLGAL